MQQLLQLAGLELLGGVRDAQLVQELQLFVQVGEDALVVELVRFI